MDIQAPSEITFYQDSAVVVTLSRFVTHSKSYAMRNISSVHLTEIEASRKFPVILGAVGLVMLVATGAKIAGTIMLIISVALFFGIKNNYAARISTNSGEANSIVSKDKSYIQDIVNALNEAIIHRW